jgi:hypothetical protein
MYLKKCFLVILCSTFLISCWKYPYDNDNGNSGVNGIAAVEKVWGYKPVYGHEPVAKGIVYSSSPRPVINAGNIYAFRNYFFQVESGFGIHVFDSTNPASASRIGFITVKGCSELSIRNDKLYTNSYDDLVVLDFSDLNNVKEYSRLSGVFTEYRYNSPIAQPPVSGYYECPSWGSFVVEWVQDSVDKYCYKN